MKTPRIILYSLGSLLVIIFLFFIILGLLPSSVKQETLKKQFATQDEGKVRSSLIADSLCQEDSDCTEIEGKCPFGCKVYVNKKVTRISGFTIDGYQTSCQYQCETTNGTSCIQGRCVASEKAIAAHAGWKLYTNTEMGFSIQHPPDWTVKSSGGGNVAPGIEISSPLSWSQGNVRDGDYINIIIYQSNSIQSQRDFAKYFNGIPNQIYQLLEQPITIKNYPAIMFGRSDTTSYKQIYIDPGAGRKLFNITAASYEIPAIKEIIQTFSIL